MPPWMMGREMRMPLMVSGGSGGIAIRGDDLLVGV